MNYDFIKEGQSFWIVCANGYLREFTRNRDSEATYFGALHMNNVFKTKEDAKKAANMIKGTLKTFDHSEDGISGLIHNFGYGEYDTYGYGCYLEIKKDDGYLQRFQVWPRLIIQLSFAAVHYPITREEITLYESDDLIYDVEFKNKDLSRFIFNLDLDFKKITESN